ncbi:putative wall-associated receptor kinase-like 16 [Oryza brachyantha]|nr:putative wall-associated receptor kinase-like 16 [Oryza brachyantha]
MVQPRLDLRGRRRLVLLLSSVAASWMLAAAAAVALPGCQSRCGDVDVPYPFGIGRGCAIHGGFELSCTSAATGAAAGTSKLRLLAAATSSPPPEVTRISERDGKVWVKSTIATQCYNATTGRLESTTASANFSSPFFSLSPVDNKIVVIGCRSLGYMQSDTYAVGCSATCGADKIPANGSCSGAGCCQADVPRGVRSYVSFFNDNYNASAIWRNTPCNYVALMEAAAFRFSTGYLTTTAFADRYAGNLPVVVDWVVSPQKCSEARGGDRISAYACVSSNSECVDGELGYRCRCSKGYGGNPYITGGCTDIDECHDNVTYPCAGICKNTLGSFECSCPKGKHMMQGGYCMVNDRPVWVMPLVGASAGVVILVIFITCSYLFRERHKLHKMKKKYFRQHGGMLLFEEMKSQQGVAFKIFSEEELRQATNKFHEQHILGHGGHGIVYKGVLKGGDVVAIKKCTTIDEQQKKEFGREMLILSQINHRNIVKLLGCCLEVEVPILVYEYIPNGTLFHLIHGDHGCHISLKTRLRIAHESAEALSYLHSCASPPILHGDVKSTNILLGGDYTVKVSDFGASILAPTDEAQFVTLVQGTCGYLDPEYMQTCQLTEKSDVYSFGVVLLELLTRKKAFNLEGPEHEKSLSMWFLSMMKENKLMDILDDQIKNDENIEHLEEIAELAKKCLEMCGEDRPLMKEVVEKIDKLRKVMEHPWEQQNREDLDDLLGEWSAQGIVDTGNFSIEKEVVNGLKLGR